MPSSAATSIICPASWATCCSRWSTTASWRREEGRFGFAEVVDGITAQVDPPSPACVPRWRPVCAAGCRPGWTRRRSSSVGKRSRPRSVPTKAAAPEQLSLLTMCLGPAGSVARGQAASARRQVGFDWPAPLPVLDKVREELDEVLEAMAENDPAAHGRGSGRLAVRHGHLAGHSSSWSPEAALRGGQCASSNGACVSSSGPCAPAAGPWRTAPSTSWTPVGRGQARERQGGGVEGTAGGPAPPPALRDGDGGPGDRRRPRRSPGTATRPASPELLPLNVE